MSPDDGKVNGRCLKIGLQLLKLGYWVVAIRPGEKRPIGVAWGAERWTPERLRETFEREHDAGIGICFGPGRGPGGVWLIDVEGDGPQAGESLSKLLGGDQVEVQTVAWSSTRGAHWLFAVEGARLLGALKAAGAKEQKGSPGVWHLAALPDLEFRVGGTKEDDTVKQLQSVCPPTPGTDGNPRAWIGSPRDGVCYLPTVGYEYLASLGYGRSALEGETASVAIARAGERHAALLQSTLRLASLVKAGKLSEQAALDALHDAARSNGLAGEGRAAEVDDCWASAMGMASARKIGKPAVAARNGVARPAVAPVVDDPPIHLTDLGNARRLVKAHGSEIRYSWPWSKWLVWTGQRWKIDAIGSVQRLARKIALSMCREAGSGESIDQALVKWAIKSEARERLAAMVAVAQAEEGIPVLPDDLDRNPWLLNVQNGTLDLRSGAIRGHDRKDLITAMAPVAFDEAAECPLWMEILGRIFGEDDDLIRFWGQVCGLCLTGIASEHILPILYGAGANGKSTILGALLEMMGTDYGLMAPPGLLVQRKSESHPTERASLFGKRLVVDMESAEGARLNEAWVKQLTGSDRITARRMREDFWDFAPTHKIIMGTNHRPIVRETKNAIWRRIKLVPFNVIIPEEEQVHDLPVRLRAEFGGILNWAIRGCLDWQENGLKIPDQVSGATEEYRNEQDILAVFFADECLVAAPARVRAGQLYDRYRAWSEKNGETPISLKAFGTSMRERGFEQAVSRGKWYLGIQLRSKDDDDSRDPY